MPTAEEAHIICHVHLHFARGFLSATITQRKTEDSVLPDEMPIVAA
jgi:hypothetical protein